MNDIKKIDDINERLARFADAKKYVIEMRLGDCIDYKIEMYKNLTDTIPEVIAPLSALYNLIDCFQFVEHIVIYDSCIIFDITRL